MANYIFCMLNLNTYTTFFTSTVMISMSNYKGFTKKEYKNKAYTYKHRKYSINTFIIKHIHFFIPPLSLILLHVLILFNYFTIFSRSVNMNYSQVSFHTKKAALENSKTAFLGFISFPRKEFLFFGLRTRMSGLFSSQATS